MQKEFCISRKTRNQSCMLGRIQFYTQASSQITALILTAYPGLIVSTGWRSPPLNLFSSNFDLLSSNFADRILDCTNIHVMRALQTLNQGQRRGMKMTERNTMLSKSRGLYVNEVVMDFQLFSNSYAWWIVSRRISSGFEFVGIFSTYSDPDNDTRKRCWGFKV